jgi:hypothetical protein
MAETLDPGLGWLDAVTDERHSNDIPLVSLNSFESDPEGMALAAQRNECPSSVFDTGSDVDSEFLSLDGLLKGVVSDKEPTPPVVISALGQLSPGPRRPAKLIAPPRRSKQQSPPFLRYLLFHGSSAIPALAVSIVVFKIMGVDLLTLRGPFGLHWVLLVIFGTLAFSSAAFATCNYLVDIHRLKGDRFPSDGDCRRRNETTAPRTPRGT